MLVLYMKWAPHVNTAKRKQEIGKNVSIMFTISISPRLVEPLPPLLSSDFFRYLDPVRHHSLQGVVKLIIGILEKRPTATPHRPSG